MNGIKTRKEGPRTGKGEEFGYQGPAVWQNTAEDASHSGCYRSHSSLTEATQDVIDASQDAKEGIQAVI